MTLPPHGPLIAWEATAHLPALLLPLSFSPIPGSHVFTKATGRRASPCDHCCHYSVTSSAASLRSKRQLSSLQGLESPAPQDSMGQGDLSGPWERPWKEAPREASGALHLTFPH